MPWLRPIPKLRPISSKQTLINQINALLRVYHNSWSPGVQLRHLRYLKSICKVWHCNVILFKPYRFLGKIAFDVGIGIKDDQNAYLMLYFSGCWKPPERPKKVSLPFGRERKVAGLWLAWYISSSGGLFLEKKVTCSAIFLLDWLIADIRKWHISHVPTTNGW